MNKKLIVACPACAMHFSLDISIVRTPDKEKDLPFNDIITAETASEPLFTKKNLDDLKAMHKTIEDAPVWNNRKSFQVMEAEARAAKIAQGIIDQAHEWSRDTFMIDLKPNNNMTNIKAIFELTDRLKEVQDNIELLRSGSSVSVIKVGDKELDLREMSQTHLNEFLIKLFYDSAENVKKQIHDQLTTK
jgi:hypothetical protein